MIRYIYSNQLTTLLLLSLIIEFLMCLFALTTEETLPKHRVSQTSLCVALNLEGQAER